MFKIQDEYKFVYWPVLLIVSTNQIWHFVLWWTGETWEWPVPYNTDKGQIWLFGIVILPWHNDLAVYNARWVQTCRFDSLFGNIQKSNLTLCTVMNRWNLRVASTLHHRRRSILIVWNCQLKTQQSTNARHCRRDDMWQGGGISRGDDVPQGFNRRGGHHRRCQKMWHCRGVKPESGQYPTSQTKVNFDWFELSICHDIMI